MKLHALPIAVLAGTLLLTGCGSGSSTSPSSTAGASSSSPSATATQGSDLGTSSSGTGIGNPSGTSVAPAFTGKPGVATDAQVTAINKVARAIADEKYTDAAAAGYNASPGEMSSVRSNHDESFDTAKDAFAKGCHLEPRSINSSGTIFSDMICADGSTPNVEIDASFAGGKINYIDALYAN